MQGIRSTLFTLFLTLFAVALLAGRPALARDYVLAPGDSLSVTVVGEPDYSGSFRVNDDGRIFIKNIGGVVASGKTADTLRTELTERLKAYFKSPTVIVDITTANNSFVWVTGGVRTPSQIKVVPGARISYYLKQAGNLTDEADRTKGSLVRPGVPDPINLDLEAIVRGTDASKDVEAQAGDTIYVPTLVIGRVKILGEVANQGDKDLREKLSPMEAITTLANGFKPTADKSNVTIQHKDGTRVTVDLDAEARGEDSPLTRNLYLQEGDVIFVPNDENSRVNVSGLGVTTPGRVEFSADMRVMDAILKSGNFTDAANKESVTIHRKSGETITVDMDKYLREADVSQNVVLEKGDTVLVGTATSDTNQVEVSGLGVQNAGKYPFQPGMRVVDAITQAGGFVERAKVREVNVVRKDGKPIRLNLDKYLNDGDMAQNLELERGDIVLVGLEKEKSNKRNWAEMLIPSLGTALLYGIIYR